MLVEDKRLAGWCWSQWMDFVLQNTIFCRLLSRAVLLSSQMIKTRKEVPIWSLSTISRRQRPQILEAVRLLQTPVVIRGDFRSLSSSVLPRHWHHCTPVLQFTFCWWEAAAQICREGGSGADGEALSSQVCLWRTFLVLCAWKWDCRHEEHGASTPAGTPARQGGWNLAEQRPGQDYSLREVSHSLQTAGCVVTATETWVKRDIARLSEHSMLGLSAQSSCLRARAAHRWTEGELGHGTTSAGLFLFTCPFLVSSMCPDLEGSHGMKPQSNTTESCSALGRWTWSTCSSLEPFPQFRKRQAGLFGRTKIDFCSNKKQKMSGARQYSQLVLIQLWGKGRCFHTKQDGKDSKGNLRIGLLVEGQMRSRAETSCILHIKTSPAEFVVMFQSPCPGEVGCRDWPECHLVI